ncbi:DUF58 domain-containing protein [Herbiconiux sp.]|uniref:DUF58 domain-containing protein n=1 Tax=Herbiconiux sp. TaxID=1871186 RepID=UPI0025C07BF9|nr:DUF58 domain-containing protein [Herbiconiux sp.]
MAAHRPPRSVPRPTARGWGLIAAAVVVFVLTQVFRRQELAYLACFLLAVPVFSFAWVVLRRIAISVRRRFAPESGSVGQLVVVNTFLQNWGSVRTPAAVWSEGASAPVRPSPPAALDALPAYLSSALDEPGVTQLRYRLDTRVRGAHEIGPFTLTLSDPFGCALRRLTFGSTDTVLVTPEVFELARIDLRLATGDGAEQVSRRLIGAGEQDVIARKYLPGDSIRRVHWPATAKHGELMVRQDDQRNDQDAVILLDAASFADRERAAGRSQRGAGEPDAAFEWAVSAAASIGVHLVTEGYGVRIVGHSLGRHEPQADGSFLAPHGQSALVRELAFARSDGPDDADAFRAAVAEASLTSPDAPPVFALVAERDEPAGRPGPRGGAGPLAASRLRDLAAMSSHPVAFVVGRPGAVGFELRQAGWNVVPVGSSDRLAELWRSLGEARGIA